MSEVVLIQVTSTPRSRRRRAVSTGVALAAGASLAFAGCGGGTAKTAGGAGDVAGFLPAGSPVYIEASTDLAGSQWTQALALASRFPGYPDLIAKAGKELSAQGIDFNTQIKPLLGEDAAIGVYDVQGLDERSPDPKFVGAIDLADGKDAEFVTLITSGKDPVKKIGVHAGVDIYGDGEDGVLAVLDGKVIIADSEAQVSKAIDAHRAGTSATMAGSTRLATALAELPDEVVAQGFVDFAALMKSAAGSATADMAKQLSNAGIGPDASLAFSVSAESDGVRLKGVGLGFTNAATDVETFTPKLVARVPADAIGFAELRNVYGQAEKALAQLAGDPQLAQGLNQAKAALPLLGISLDDVKNLTGGQHAFVVTKGAPTPAVVAALEVEDPARATATLDKLRTTVPPLLSSFADTKIPPFTAVDLANGVKGWESPISPKAGAVYGVDGNTAYVGTAADAIRKVQAPAATLSDDPAFQAATRQMPAKVSGLLWVNGEGLLTTLDALGALKDAPKGTIANVRPLKNLAAWSTGGEKPTFEAFLTIK